MEGKHIPGAAAIVAVLLFAGCSASTSASEAAADQMASDPIAAKVRADMTLLSSSEQVGQESKLFSSKRTVTRVLRTFRTTRNVDQVIADLRREATETGWRLEPGSTASGVRGVKTMPFGEARLSITSDERQGFQRVVVQMNPTSPDI